LAKVTSGRRKNLGYLSASSIVILLGFLLATQTELKDDGNPNSSQTLTANTPSQNNPSPSGTTLTPNLVTPNLERVVQKTNFSPLAEEFKLAFSLTTSERIKFWSAYIEGGQSHRDKISDLANGFTIEDIVPIVPKKYDCTTFVETVAALSKSNSPDQFIAQLVTIRYKDGATNFHSRNHFPEIDWIPNNERAGILKDITKDIAQSHGLAIQITRKEITRSKWLAVLAKQLGAFRELASTDERAAEVPIQAEVPYISLNELKGVVDKIPEGVVINLVHNSHSLHSGMITHQGFLIREGRQYFLRHASKNGIIRSSELFAYLTSRQKKSASWPVVGVNLNQFSDSSSSTSRLSDAM
jgi:hypothetical protein